jgi:hypothetical protein
MLPEPILTFSLYEPFCDVVKCGLDAYQRTARYIELTSLLPRVNRDLLNTLLPFLDFVASMSCCSHSL